ncbi:threonine/serine ThrE exporter family protein [Luteimonas cucumeris]|uniref:threonine/serine ThrE exporter family protein n=1 Tax=Luteimonas cucumeris TaxID=985012 RepID=UPI001F54E56E|nr:threonine/serine exporter family protein [Luteimonas cucumeris]
MSIFSPASERYAARVEFVVDMAGRLHTYGTTAQRLEAAVVAVAQRLKLDCEPWSNPTGMILSFSDPSRPPGESDTTRVVRLAPGQTDLHKLCEADRIAEDVTSGRLDLAGGRAALERLDRLPSARWRTMQVLAFGLAAAALAGLLRLPWLDIATAGLTGLAIGLVELLSERRPLMKEASDALAAVVATAVVVLVAAFVGPLNLNTVIIASLIVLLPGLALTNAVNELASQHLVSGTARFAGAVMTVLKLTIGTMTALAVAQLLGIEPEVRYSRPQPMWVEGGALVLATFAFGILFRAGRRDFAIVMLAAATGYLISRTAGQAWGSEAGVFVAALVMTAAGNIYASWRHRPGALIRVPGIIMLVPGSTSLRGLLTFVQQQNLDVGQAALITVLNILLALIAGMLFGNLIAPTRRSL